MSYSVSILPRAQKELGQVPSPIFERVCDAIRALGSNPRPPGCRKLVQREGWRIRVGDYPSSMGLTIPLTQCWFSTSATGVTYTRSR